MLAYVGVFASDAVLVFLALKEREAWAQGAFWRGTLVDCIAAVAGTASIVLTAEYSWSTLPAAIAGVIAGRALAWRF